MSVLAEKLLPLDTEIVQSAAASKEAHKGITLFEPSPREVWSAILPRIMRSRVRQAFLDARASEHGSRMTAMDSATKNSGDIIDALKLSYNKLRQGRITAELLDLIGGSEALS
jgi:F-type H+-transporting ATPase subunit gamma